MSNRELNGCSVIIPDQIRNRSGSIDNTRKRDALASFRAVGRFLARTIRSYPRSRDETLIEKKEGKNARGKRFFSLFFSHVELSPHTRRTSVRTHERPIARELRKAMQARATRRALVPSPTFFTRRGSRLVLSPSSLPSLSIHLVASLSVSFPLHRMNTHHSRSFSLSLSTFHCLSPSLSISDTIFSVLVAAPFCLYIDEIRLSSFNVLPDDLLLIRIHLHPSCRLQIFWPSLSLAPRLFETITVSLLSRPCPFRSMLTPVQFNSFISGYLNSIWKKNDMIQCFPWKLNL